MKKIIILTLGFLFGMSSCMKDTYDNPAQITDPNLKATTDIKTIKSRYIASGLSVMSITDDAILSGIITADDQSGNFYKEIVLQDGTGAIGIKIDRSNLFNDYPIGRRVFVKLKGMALGNYSNLIQLGGFVDTVTVSGGRVLGSVTSTALPNQLIKGSLGNKVDPLVITLDKLTNDHQYMLIKVVKVELDCIDINNTYADGINQLDASRTLNDANGNSAFLRSSGYSNFASTKVPQGNGDFVGIYTVFKTDKQLKIRTTADLPLNGTRNVSCTGGGGGGGGTTTGTPISIQNLRAMYTTTGIAVDGLSIQGIVISDKDNANVGSGTIIVQEEGTGGSGIMVYLSSANTFSLGDKVKIEISNDSIIRFKGALELKGVSNSKVTKIGTGVITPTVLTISQVKSGVANLESTLVTVNAATISGGATYGANTSGLTMTDASSSMTLYTSSTATFKTASVPTGSKNITGIVSLFYTTAQLQMRNLGDVQ